MVPGGTPRAPPLSVTQRNVSERAAERASLTLDSRKRSPNLCTNSFTASKAVYWSFTFHVLSIEFFLVSAVRQSDCI